jgi:hypothetical protein
MKLPSLRSVESPHRNQVPFFTSKVTCFFLDLLINI